MSPSLRDISSNSTKAKTAMIINTLTVFFFQNILLDFLID